MLGPYVGSDGAGLTGLTVTQSALMLSKNGAAFVAKNETTNASHRILGYYSAMFDNTDVGSLGILLIVSSAANALPVRHSFAVLPSSVYDAMVNGSAIFQTNLVQWLGTAPNALVSNRVDATVGAIQNVVVTSAAFAQDGIDRIVNNVWDEPLSETRTGSSYGVKVQSLFTTAVGQVSVGSLTVNSAALTQDGIDRIVNNVWDEPLSETRVGSSYGVKVQSFFTTDVGQVSVGSLQVTSAALTPSGVQRMANIFSVDIRSISVSINDRSPANALRALRNRITTSGGLTVYAEDDTTAVWTGALTTNASAAPIVESDPA